MMNANKKTALFFFLSAALVLPFASAKAQGSAPAMLNVKELRVQHTRLGNNAASDLCGLSPSETMAHVLSKLKEDKLPAFSALESPSSQMGVARIDVVPEIVTLQKQGLDCTSWVSLAAQSRSTLRVPPVEVPRYVTVVYWRGGLMVSSPQVSHARAVRDALVKLATQFSRQYRNDQPPPMDELGGE